jgi:RND superfamily putative drug exporter
MQNGLAQLSRNYGKIQGGVKQMADTLGSIEAKLKQLGKDHPEIVQDPNYQYAIGATQKLMDSADQINQNLTKLNKNLDTITQKMNQANQGFSKLVDAQEQFSDQLQGAVDGITKLQNGLNQLANGQRKAVDNIPKISKGLGDINSGQVRLKKGFSKMIDQLSQLTGGLGKSVNGLNKVSGGIQDARDYLSGLSQSSGPLAGFYIPSEAIHNKDFKKSLDHYMSDNRKFTTLDVVFKTSPYSDETIGQIGHIQAAVDRATDGTPLENAKIGIGGASSTYHDMKQISDRDYTQTVILMLIGIGLILIALLRSFIMPMYILLSLVVTYYTAMGITELIYVNLLGYSGLNWAMPFFGFVVLMALGVDYSIFLMDRFNEHRNMPVKDAILHAMKNMGGVISSAAIILGGTFAAMIPSGVMALVEFATILIVGLLLYNILMLPLFIPVMVKMFGKANWWPFKRSDE